MTHKTNDNVLEEVVEISFTQGLIYENMDHHPMFIHFSCKTYKNLLTLLPLPPVFADTVYGYARPLKFFLGTVRFEIVSNFNSETSLSTRHLA